MATPRGRSAHGPFAQPNEARGGEFKHHFPHLCFMFLPKEIPPHRRVQAAFPLESSPSSLARTYRGTQYTTGTLDIVAGLACDACVPLGPVTKCGPWLVQEVVSRENTLYSRFDKVFDSTEMTPANFIETKWRESLTCVQV